MAQLEGQAAQRAALEAAAESCDDEDDSEELFLSDKLQKEAAMTALLLAVQAPGIDAFKTMEAVVQQGEAAGLGDSLLSSAQAVLAMMRGIADESAQL